MSVLLQKLTAEGDGERAGFLNDIVSQLWPNINIAGSKMIKEIADPMFKSMLPGPLATLHFTKIDLGSIPMVFSNVRVTKTTTDGIKLDMNVDWDGKCNIELDGDMMPQVGVDNVELHGRLSIFLCPLTNIIPLVGAAQVAFINPPVLKLNFTGAADIADFSLLDGAIRKVIISIINGIAVLPNPFLIKLDSNNDYFKTFIPPLGIARITVDKAWDFVDESQSKTSRLLSKLTRASPDCYAEVEVGAEAPWKTTIKNNTTTPSWNEKHDFIVSDFDQCIKISVQDQDVGSDDQVGFAVTSVKDILLAGGKQELGMMLKDDMINGKVSLGCEIFHFEASSTSFSAAEHSGNGQMCGIITVLVAGLFGLKGERQELNPSVVVTWGPNHRFQTVVKTDAPGTDISNPAFDQHFRIPLTADMVGSEAPNIRIQCMNKEVETGVVEVSFADLLKASNMTLEDNFALSNGATVRLSISLRGLSKSTNG